MSAMHTTMSNIRKPLSRSRRWRATRRKRPAKANHTNGTPIVRVRYTATANTGKSARPPAFKPTPFDVTTAQRTAHEANAASPIIRVRGAFGGCTVAERQRRQEKRRKEMVA